MANKLQTLATNPKTRNGFMVIGSIIVVGVIGGIIAMKMGSGDDKISGNARVSGPSGTLNVTPGGSTSAEYIGKLEEHNKQVAEKALESGKTSTGVLTGGSNLSDTSPLDMLGDSKNAPKQAVKDEVEITPQEAVVLPTVNVASAPPVTTEVYSAPPPPKFGTTEDYYILQMGSSVWAAKPSRSEYNYLGQGKPLEVEAQEREAFEQSASAATAKAETRPAARTGEILNAVLETGVNSDEPGPILATIVSGEFKGARLVGAAKRRNEKMILEFSTITVPGKSASSSISAVAIDINSIEQASTLASSVDNHYFKKYGLLFAASLLGAYSEAIKDQGTTQVITPQGGVITTNDGNKSSKQINRESLGGVGKAMSGEIQRESSQVVPTVKVNRGTAIGVLLMSDLKLKN